jgi:hypothetical protein
MVVSSYDVAVEATVAMTTAGPPFVMRVTS